MNESDYNASRPLEEQAAALEAELIELLREVAARHGLTVLVPLLRGLVRWARDGVDGVWS